MHGITDYNAGEQANCTVPKNLDVGRQLRQCVTCRRVWQNNIRLDRLENSCLKWLGGSDKTSTISVVGRKFWIFFTSSDPLRKLPL
jgi:hypothetical protein